MGSIDDAVIEIRETGGLTKNPFREGSLLYDFCDIADIDWAKGESKFKKVSNLPDRFHHHNGGSWHREDGSAGIFIWEKKRQNDQPSGKIIGFEIVGYNVHFQSKKKSFKTQEGRCVFTGMSSGRLIEDHKEGDWQKYDKGDVRVNTHQTILEKLNLSKRTACNKCQESSIRPPSPKGHVLDYTYGDKKYGAPYYCKGCFIYDPAQFRVDERNKLLAECNDKIKNLQEKNENQQRILKSLI